MRPINLKLLRLKIQISFVSILTVLLKPLYLLLFIFGWLVAEAMMLWSLNLELVKFVLIDSGVHITTKLEFFFSVYRDIFLNYGSLQGSSILLFSALFGINLALLVFTFRGRNKESIPKKSGIASTLLAIVGGGCLACGTSILYPVLVTLGVSTTIFAQKIGIIITWLAIGFLLYSIYKLGGVASFIIKSSK
jgi:hypothetical protein